MVVDRGSQHSACMDASLSGLDAKTLIPQPLALQLQSDESFPKGHLLATMCMNVQEISCSLINTFLTAVMSLSISGGCQEPAGGRTAGSGTEPGPLRHHGAAEAGRDQGADPARDSQRAEDQRRCREPTEGKLFDHI